MLYSISCYYDDIQAALGLAGLAVFEMIAQEVSIAKPPTEGCRNSITFKASAGRYFLG
jgi:hypothetical protein